MQPMHVHQSSALYVSPPLPPLRLIARPMLYAQKFASQISIKRTRLAVPPEGSKLQAQEQEKQRQLELLQGLNSAQCNAKLEEVERELQRLDVGQPLFRRGTSISAGSTISADGESVFSDASCATAGSAKSMRGANYLKLPVAVRYGLVTISNVLQICMRELRVAIVALHGI